MVDFQGVDGCSQRVGGCSQEWMVAAREWVADLHEVDDRLPGGGWLLAGLVAARGWMVDFQGVGGCSQELGGSIHGV